jgi:predicted dienelactone hydrolase
MQAPKWLGAIVFCLSTTLAHGAGFRTIDIPSEAGRPALKGAAWYPCAQSPGEVNLGKITLPAVKDCPLPGEKLPLIVVSHGRGGSFVGHHDTDEVLADAGFIVAAINHPGDTVSDLSQSGDLSIFVERPNHIKRLIDFMVGTSPFASQIDQSRIGFFGFSRGGYTGLVLIGADPEWASATALCAQSTAHICDQLRNKDFPPQELTHDPRIKASVIVDPLTIAFGDGSFSKIKVPVQLWASEFGGDGVLPHSVDIVDRNLRPKHEYRTVSGAGHFGFLAPCPPDWIKELPELCLDTAGFDRVAFHRQFDADVLAFFRAQLANEPR